MIAKYDQDRECTHSVKALAAQAILFQKVTGCLDMVILFPVYPMAWYRRVKDLWPGIGTIESLVCSLV